MSTPKRYDLIDPGDAAGMEERSNGDWVSYDEYAELADRFAEAEEKIQRAISELK